MSRERVAGSGWQSSDEKRQINRVTGVAGHTNNTVALRHSLGATHTCRATDDALNRNVVLAVTGGA